MSNKFIPNSFQVPNALVDDVIADLPPNALKCYLIIVRKTVGWQKEWDYIPTAQLMELSGIKKKDTVYKAIQDLEKLDLIEAIKETGKVTNYRLKVVPKKVVPLNGTSTDESEKAVPKKGTGTSTDNGDTSKDTNKNKQNIKNKQKDFTFNLSKSIQYENLSEDYKEQLNIYSLLKDRGNKFSQFLDHHISKGTKFKDWSRAYNTWIANAQKFDGYKPEDYKPSLTLIMVKAGEETKQVQAYDCGSVLVTEDGIILKKKISNEEDEIKEDIDVMSILQKRSA